MATPEPHLSYAWEITRYVELFFLNRDALTKLLLQRQGFERGMRRRGFGRAAVVREEAFLR